MKVKFFSNYMDSEDLLKRFKANYEVYDDELTLTVEEDYDFAVVFNRTADTIRVEAKLITVIQEPSWSDAHGLQFLTRSDYILIHEPGLFEWNNRLKLGGKIIETPTYIFYNDEIDRSFFQHSEKVVKTKKVSMVVSNLNFRIGNYKRRLSLVEEILKSDLDIDIYGRGLNIADPRYKGELVHKYEGLLSYEYSIAIENCNEKNYVTEKFIDCVLCNTIPIYNGAPNITDIYDGRYMRKIEIWSDTIIEEIKEIIKEPAPDSRVNKDIYFEQYNLYAKLKEIILKN